MQHKNLIPSNKTKEQVPERDRERENEKTDESAERGK